MKFKKTAELKSGRENLVRDFDCVCLLVAWLLQWPIVSLLILYVYEQLRKGFKMYSNSKMATIYLSKYGYSWLCLLMLVNRPPSFFYFQEPPAVLWNKQRRIYDAQWNHLPKLFFHDGCPSYKSLRLTSIELYNVYEHRFYYGQGL